MVWKNGFGLLAAICLVVLLCSVPSLGQLCFTDITVSANTAGPTRRDALGGHGVMFADVDKDGLADFYVTMIFTKPMPDLFFHNLGNSTFASDGTLRDVDDFDGGSHGACWADLDNDGDFDLVKGTTWDNPDFPNHNNIFRDDGSRRFTEVTPECMRDRRAETRGVICFDMDNDGDLDIFCVSGWKGSGDPAEERNEVYRNDGDFHFKALATGRLYSCPAGQGASDTDYDGDGDIDVFACNRDGDLNILRNEGRFNDFTQIVPSSVGVKHRAYSGVTKGDIDNDGDLDFAVGVKRSRNWLVRNDCTDDNGCLKVRLVSPQGQAGAFGAKVKIYPAGKAPEGTLLGFCQAKSNYGYLGQDDPVLHFGLGRRTSVDVIVFFLDGSATICRDLVADQIVTIREN